ncbi:DNA breaking-rejoining protein [Kosakonia sacchari]|uniref:DNA breaking-rejoining protein n=1 Tax=Kosakonia sacchari TaxID=1158459 RepID=UPI00158507FB|nr:DNA breaking-rejoining protein [Kosakonia sacchari]NUL36600.1 DNA breaking-rejoining protein [Kosakonia sacchari]
MIAKTVEIIAIEFKIKALNKDFASFNCGNDITGIIHVPDKGNVTVIFEGRYVFGSFDCPACAVDAITDLHAELIFANKTFGMDYAEYKVLYKNTSASKVH